MGAGPPPIMGVPPIRGPAVMAAIAPRTKKSQRAFNKK
jgi:hypothetical protein